MLAVADLKLEAQRGAVAVVLFERYLIDVGFRARDGRQPRPPARPTRLLMSSWISEGTAGPCVPSHATDSHFSGCLRYSARLPHFWRWIITPRPAERYAMMGSFGNGEAASRVGHEQTFGAGDHQGPAVAARRAFARGLQVARYERREPLAQSDLLVELPGSFKLRSFTTASMSAADIFFRLSDKSSSASPSSRLPSSTASPRFKFLRYCRMAARALAVTRKSTTRDWESRPWP